MQFAKAAVMRRAWAIFSRTYNFPLIPFRSIGRQCFSACLRMAWDEARRAAAMAARPLADLQARAEDLRRQIEYLAMAPFGIDAGRERARLNAALAPVKAEITRRQS